METKYRQRITHYGTLSHRVWCPRMHMTTGQKRRTAQTSECLKCEHKVRIAPYGVFCGFTKEKLEMLQ